MGEQGMKPINVESEPIKEKTGGDQKKTSAFENDTTCVEMSLMGGQHLQIPF